MTKRKVAFWLSLRFLLSAKNKNMKIPVFVISFLNQSTNSKEYKFADLKDCCKTSIDELEAKISKENGKETVLIAYTKC